MPNDSPRGRSVFVLLIGGIILPIAIAVSAGAAGLFEMLGDSAAGDVLKRIALAFGLIWLIDLVCLLLVVAWNAVVGDPTPRD